MATSIYFTAKQIQVLQGKLTKDLLHVQKVYTEDLEPGTIINGVITNEAAIFRSMENLLSKVKLQKEKLDLIVDSGSVLTKRLDVPILPMKKLDAIAKNEFAEVEEHHEDLVYDFSVMNRLNPNGQGGAILCAAMESSLIFSYIDLFKRLKLRLNTMDLALSAQGGLVHYLPELREETFILATLDGDIIALSLYVKGQYFFSNRTRLLEERQSEKIIAEITQSISSLMQFNNAQKTGEDISHVYFCGVRQEGKEQMERLSERLLLPVSPVNNSPAVRVSSEISDFKLSDYFYAAGNLLIKDGAYHG